MRDPCHLFESKDHSHPPSIRLQKFLFAGYPQRYRPHQNKHHHVRLAALLVVAREWKRVRKDKSEDDPSLSRSKAESCLRDPKKYFMPLLPKTRAMFASRACRGAIMIGTALDYKTMLKEIRNMSTIDRPWNCPHGLPTLQHLTK